MLEDKFGTEFCGNVSMWIGLLLIIIKKLAKYGGVKDSGEKKLTWRVNEPAGPGIAGQ